jgi:hypothetical protein
MDDSEFVFEGMFPNLPYLLDCGIEECLRIVVYL